MWTMGGSDNGSGDWASATTWETGLNFQLLILSLTTAGSRVNHWFQTVLKFFLHCATAVSQASIVHLITNGLKSHSFI